MIKIIQRHVVAFFATLAISFHAAATTYSTDYTDLWWGGTSESGWGINLIQQGEVIFDSGFRNATELEWPLLNQQGEALIDTTNDWLESHRKVRSGQAKTGSLEAGLHVFAYVGRNQLPAKRRES